MGFFSGISRMIKRNVNLHTAVKLAGQATSSLPGVGGLIGGTIQELQAQHDDKVANRNMSADAAANGFPATTELGKTLAGQAVNALGKGAAGGAVVAAGGLFGAAAITTWIKQHAKILIGVLVVGVAAVWYMKRKKPTSTRSYRK